MTTNMKIVLGIGVLVATTAVGILLFSRAPMTASSRTIQGAVTSVSPDTSQIVISTNSGEKTAVITSATRIEKEMSQVNASGAVEKQASIALAISDLAKGDLITIEYLRDADGILSGVSRVVLAVEGDVDAFLAQAVQNTDVLLRGEVVSIDIAKKTILYHPYVFDTVGTTTASISIPAGVVVYRVSDPQQAATASARTAAALTDIQPEQTIFFVIPAKTLQGGDAIPQEIIIVEK